MKNRKGEHTARYFRTERMQQANGSWFFLTRECVQEGPFRTRKEAVEALQRHSAVWQCNLFSNNEFDKINSLGLQAEIVPKSALTAVNEPRYSQGRTKKARARYQR